jgi:NADH-quinone oxidoreductase subunit I
MEGADSRGPAEHRGHGRRYAADGMNRKMTDRRTSLLKTTLRAIKGLYGSHAVAMTNLLRKPVTEEYPEYKRPLPERSRGRIVLTRDPEGDERCVACYLCSAVCPTSCISMESAERQGDGRRYPLWFRINFARCIYCGQCEEACPTLAIQLTPILNSASTRCSISFTKKRI